MIKNDANVGLSHRDRIYGRPHNAQERGGDNLLYAFIHRISLKKQPVLNFP